MNVWICESHEKLPILLYKLSRSPICTVYTGNVTHTHWVGVYMWHVFMGMQDKNFNGSYRLAVISQPRPCISSLIFQLSLSLCVSLGLSVIGWEGWWHISGWWGSSIKPLSCLPSDTEYSYRAPLSGYLSTAWRKRHPYEHQLAAMCKGLASLSTCCLERYRKIHAYMADVWGFGLQDMEDSTATLSLCVCV